MQSITLILAPLFWTQLPPLGLAYLAQYLKQKKLTVFVRDLNISIYHLASNELRKRWSYPHNKKNCVSLFDAVASELSEEFEAVITSLIAKRSRIYAFSVFRSNKDFSLSLAAEIKRRKKESIIIFGGPEMKDLIRDVDANKRFRQNKIVDTIVVGEGELTLEKILSDIEQDLLQTVYISGDEYDLDAIPYPTYDGFDLRLYDRKKALPILASRGCIRSCSFCSERLLSPRFRVRSAERIVFEIEQHIKSNDIRWFTFHDSLINGDLRVLEKLCTLLLERGIQIKWEAQVAIRSDMSIELMRLMKESGCFNFFIGLESGSDMILSKMNKGYTTQVAREFFQRAHTAGMHFEISLIAGFPEETNSNFEETLQFLLQNKKIIPKIAQLNPFVVFSGTEYAIKENKQYCDLPYVYNAKRARELIDRAVTFFKENEFVYTPYFINNLIYEKT